MFKAKSLLFYGCFCLSFFAGRVNAQKTAVSPYSSFGYGEYKMSNNTANFGMGGVYSAFSSVYGSQANFENPAANMNLRFTDFTFEGSWNASSFQNNETLSKRSTTYVSKISLAFPLGQKWRGGIGFQPFSTLGYDIISVSQKNGIASFNKYKGEGAINTLQFFTSYNINSNLAIGLKASYLFGNLYKEEVNQVSNISLLTSYERKNEMKGIDFSGGLFYTKEFKDKKKLSLGLNYSLGGNVNLKHNYKISTYGLLSNLRKYNEDIVFQSDNKSKLKLPQKLGFGVSFGEDFRWNVAAQMDWEQISKYKLPNENITLNDRFRTAIGGYIIPNINSYKSYFSRITYRAGAFYERTPISINNYNVKKYGITFGLGLHVGKASDPSEINFGVELGQQGTEKNNLIKENFANFKLSFTLNDSWFQRRKYN